MTPLGLTFLAMMLGTTPKVSGTWTHDVIVDAQLSQLALSNWSQGGEEALAWRGQLRGLSTLRESKSLEWSWKYEAAFGQSKTTGLRKTHDRLYFETTLMRKLGLLINPFVSASLKTQMRPGYKYERSVSKFFDPAYLTQSVGGAISRGPVKTRLGLALREVVTRDFNAYADDPATPKVEKVDVKGGMESVTDVRLELSEHTLLMSQLKLFGKYDDFSNVIVESDTQLRVELTSHVIMTVDLDLVDDARASDKWQMRQALALGLGYRFK